MHPVFLAFAIFAVVLLAGVALLAAQHVHVPRRSAGLHPWMDLDGSARRQRQRLTAMH